MAARFSLRAFRHEDPPAEAGPFGFSSEADAMKLAAIFVEHGATCEIHDLAGKRPVLVRRLTPGAPKR